MKNYVNDLNFSIVRHGLAFKSKQASKCIKWHSRIQKDLESHLTWILNCYKKTKALERINDKLLKKLGLYYLFHIHL
jgi:hypothetical protein